MLASFIFLLCSGIVLYAYVVYPCAIAWLARGKPPLPVTAGAFRGSFTVVMAVRDEEHQVMRRIGELRGLIAASSRTGHLIVVSDGSSDGTNALLERLQDPHVQCLLLTENVGKASAISRACEQAQGDILVFADVRQRWDARALDALLDAFDDAAVGAVSGELVIEAKQGVLAGVGLYWRYEKWLRHNEGIVHSTVGVSGAISAVRRPLFRPIPQGTLLDDVYWPMQVVMQGWRVVHDPRAVAFDRLPADVKGEFRRKVRTLSGNFQLCTLLPQLLSPRRNPIWLQFVSHKLARLVVPWALIGALVASALVDSPVFRALF
ncbi:MAG: glycosyltransferase, partial [Proteobacteria bacterium]|nr:glycosyltransferase [Pseudomonadota bacterium]